MRTIACEGYCPFLLLYFLVFVDNKMYICHTHLDGIISILIINLMKKMPLIRLEPSKKMVNCGFVPLMLQEY